MDIQAQGDEKKKEMEDEIHEREKNLDVLRDVLEEKKKYKT